MSRLKSRLAVALAVLALAAPAFGQITNFPSAGTATALTPGVTSGRVYTAPYNNVAAGTTTCSITLVCATLQYIPAGSYSAMQFRTNSAGTGGNAKMAVYANTNGCATGNPLAQTASTAFTGTTADWTANFTVTPFTFASGYYWVAFIEDTATGQFSNRVATDGVPQALVGGASIANVYGGSNLTTGVSVAVANYAAAFPSPWGTCTLAAISIPALTIKVN